MSYGNKIFRLLCSYFIIFWHLYFLLEQLHLMDCLLGVLISFQASKHFPFILFDSISYFDVFYECNDILYFCGLVILMRGKGFISIILVCSQNIKNANTIQINYLPVFWTKIIPHSTIQDFDQYNQKMPLEKRGQ